MIPYETIAGLFGMFIRLFVVIWAVTSTSIANISIVQVDNSLL